MTSFNLRLTAWDNLDQVWWTAKMWDFDADEENGDQVLHYLTGTMPGQGSELPTKWLRELLEEIREQL